jgi:hypothetical protein
MRKFQATARGLPIVHCSAGVGRTGVVLGTDIGIDYLHRDRKVDMLAILKSMREDRCAMIQSFEQMQFTYACVVRYARKNGLLPKKGGDAAAGEAAAEEDEDKPPAPPPRSAASLEENQVGQR